MTTSTHDHEIPRRPTGASAPLSFAQELLWLVDRATPGQTAWNVPRAFRLRGAVDRDALQRALDALVERHEVLRTVYAETDGVPRQEVLPAVTVPVRFVDLRGEAETTRAATADRLMREAATTPFDLSRDTLLRAMLIALTDDESLLFLGTHHIASDGWSKSVMFRELSALYAGFRRGAPVELPPLPIQFADYAAWERDALHEEALAYSLGYWRERLGGTLPTLTLPTDFPPPKVQGFDGAARVAVLPRELAGRVMELARAEGATLYMVLLAAYTALLHRYTGQDDIIVGSPIAGRLQPETEGLIGYFANTLVQRTSLAGDPTFAELIARARDGALGAYEHQEVPFERLVLELQRGQQLTHAPLFQVVLTMEDTIPSTFELDGVAVESLGSVVEATKFDLVMLVAQVPDGLRLTLGYRTDLFTSATAERVLGHVRTLLESAVANPLARLSELNILTDAERAQLAAWNETAADLGASATVVSLFEAQAARVPGRAAVVAPRASATAAGSLAGTQVLTYAELNARANQLARHLRAFGVGVAAPVGLLLDRNAEAVVGLLGVMKAGGAYMPLSVEAPAARIAQQLGESGARVVVTAGALAERVPAGVATVALDRDAAALGALPEGNLEPVATPESLAYVLHTSGSTGVPKGVAVTHANVVNYTRGVSRVLADVPAAALGDGLAGLDGLQFGLASTLAADLGNTSVYGALLAGGTLHVLSKETATEPPRFAEYAGVHALDVLKIAPNHLAALVAGRAGGELAAVLPRRWAVTGGEALRPDVARQLLAAGKCRLLNHYGPTETTIGVCTFEVTAESLERVVGHGAQTVPLGRPLPNTRCYVLDAYGNEQPVGVPGEHAIGGAGVARGYFRRPELTAERFADFHGDRVYRSGDRVRRLPDGDIEFLGRFDFQVKVRGYRVELGEIEQALRAHPGVAQGVVLLRTEDGDEPRLVAYAVAKQAGYAVSHSDRPTSEKLREWLAAQLPDYMVPSAVVLLDAIPLTPNGKVDRAALPAPDATLVTEDRYVEPRTETERQLAAIWAEVLKKERVGATDNFLELGGHSLMAIRVLGKISKTFGVRLPLRTLFETPTVEQLAVAVEAERTAGAPAAGGIGSISRDAYRIGKTVPAGGTGGSL